MYIHVCYVPNTCSLCVYETSMKYEYNEYKYTNEKTNIHIYIYMYVSHVSAYVHTHIHAYTCLDITCLCTYISACCYTYFDITFLCAEAGSNKYRGLPLAMPVAVFPTPALDAQNAPDALKPPNVSPFRPLSSRSPRTDGPQPHSTNQHSVHGTELM